MHQTHCPGHKLFILGANPIVLGTKLSVLGTNPIVLGTNNLSWVQNPFFRAPNPLSWAQTIYPGHKPSVKCTNRWSWITIFCPRYNRGIQAQPAVLPRGGTSPWLVFQRLPAFGMCLPKAAQCSHSCPAQEEPGGAGLHHRCGSCSLPAQHVLIFHEAPGSTEHKPPAGTAQ